MQTQALQSQSATVMAAIIAAFTSVAVLVLTASVSQIRFLYERRAERESLLNGLFAEMASICEHYVYVHAEFLETASWDHGTTLERLRLARYGDLLSTEDFGRYGFLNAEDVRLLLQLRLRIRNNDLILDSLLEKQQNGRPIALEAIPGRASYASATANEVMRRLAGKRRRLRDTLNALKREVPGIH